jgi:ferredoxin
MSSKRVSDQKPRPESGCWCQAIGRARRSRASAPSTSSRSQKSKLPGLISSSASVVVGVGTSPIASLPFEYSIGYTLVKMRVIVDYTLCESNAVCMRLVPEVFEVRDDDRLYLKTDRPPEALRARVNEAVSRCPKQALSLVED